MDTQEFRTLLGRTTTVSSRSIVIPFKKESFEKGYTTNPSFRETCKENFNYYYYSDCNKEILDDDVITYFCLNDGDLKKILELWGEFNFPKFDFFKYESYNIVTLDRRNEVFKFPIYIEMLLTFKTIVAQSSHSAINLNQAIEDLESNGKYKGVKFILNFIKNLTKDQREEIVLEDIYSQTAYHNGIISSYNKSNSTLHKKIKQWTTN